jgi:hypothetical protein
MKFVNLGVTSVWTQKTLCHHQLFHRVSLLHRSNLSETLRGVCELIWLFVSGHGKTHRDAASVQATHPIPAACGLYYFEVKIVSKGRDGYMGIGLSAQGVNMNRLPGNTSTWRCTNRCILNEVEFL